MTEPTLEQYAALACALGIARGSLYSVLSGDYNRETIARVIRGTSLANIAAAIGQREGDLAIDWNDYLTTDQQRTLQGCTDD